MDTSQELRERAAELNVPLRWINTKDMLHCDDRKPGGYIVNMQDDMDSHGNLQQGSHWVSFYIEKGKACYMDSFALAPPSQVQLCLYPLRPYTINHQQIQSMHTGHCGMYCMCFLHFMSHSKIPNLKSRFHQWLTMWDRDPEKNLKILYDYFKRLNINI